MDRSHLGRGLGRSAHSPGCFGSASARSIPAGSPGSQRRRLGNSDRRLQVLSRSRSAPRFTTPRRTVGPAIATEGGGAVLSGVVGAPWLPQFGVRIPGLGIAGGSATLGGGAASPCGWPINGGSLWPQWGCDYGNRVLGFGQRPRQWATGGRLAGGFARRDRLLKDPGNQDPENQEISTQKSAPKPAAQSS